MDFKIPNRVAMAVCAVLVGALGVVACKGLISIEGTSLYSDPSISFRAEWDATNVAVKETPGTSRVDVKFLDANGNPVGSTATGVGEGEKVPIPAGAKTVEFSGASSANSCTGCTGDGSGGGGQMAQEGDSTEHQSDAWAQNASASGREAMPMVDKWMIVQSLDADIDGSTVLKNIEASFHVHCPFNTTADQLHHKIAPILFGGPGTPVPPDVEIGAFVQMLPEPLGGRLIVADETQGFTAYSLAWNRVNGYAALDYNSQTYAADNGWMIVEVFVPTTDFSITGLSSSNTLDLSWRTAEDVQPCSIYAALSYW